MDQRLQKGQVKAKRPYKRRNVVEVPSKGPGKKTKRRKDSGNSAQISKQITKRPYNKKSKDVQGVPQKGRPSLAQQANKQAANLIHIEVGTTQVKQNIAKNSQFNPKGLMIIDKLSEFANNYLQNPPRNEDCKKKKRLIDESEWSSLSERKKKYFSIVNSYPYLKCFDENSNKEKQKKNEMNSADVEVDDQEQNKSKMEEENLNEEQNIQNMKIENEIINQSAQSQQENQIQQINVDLLKKEENVENVDFQVKDDNNKQSEENQIIIQDEEIIKEEDQPKEEEIIQEQQSEIKEENDVQNVQKPPSEIQENKDVQIYSEENILIIEEKIENGQQQQQLQQQQEEEQEKVTKPMIFERQNIVQYLYRVQPESIPSISEKFQIVYQSNNGDVDTILKEQFAQFIEDSNSLIEGIKNESFFTKVAQIINEILQNYDQCIDKSCEEQFKANQKFFFEHILELTSSLFEKMNSSLDLKEDVQLSLEKLKSVINNKIE